MKINHGLENDFNVVIWNMKSRKDAALVKKLWARVQQVLSVYESMLDSKVTAAIEEKKDAEIDADVAADTDIKEEKETEKEKEENE